MRKGGNITGYIGLLEVLFIIAMVFSAVPNMAWADESSDYVEKARLDALKAKADAQKAMAEAEMAIAEAEHAIAEAERAKAKAKKQKEHAMEKMVGHGYYPDEIAMTAPGSTTPAVFSHRKHTERERLRCIECHPKVFIMKAGSNVVKKGQLTMAEMKKGKYCGNCHNGHKAFSVTDIASCKRCHPKQ